DDDDPSAVPARWRSSDSLNTRVGTVEIPEPAGGAAGSALRLVTRGGGASDGDVVRHTFGAPRDYSRPTALRMSVREDPSGPVASWRVRLFDSGGRTVSAPIPATGAPGAFVSLDVPAFSFSSPPGGFDYLSVTGIGLEIDHGDAAATTDFDVLN